MEERKLVINYTVWSLLRYAAFAACGCGLLYTLLSTLASSDTSATAQMAQFFLGLLLTLLSGGLLYGLSYALSLIQEIKRSRLERTSESQPSKGPMFSS